MAKAEELVTAAVTSAEGSDSEAGVRLKNLQKERGKAVQNLEGGAARLALHRAEIAANEHAMKPFLGSGQGEYQQMEDCVSKIANRSELKVGTSPRFPTMDAGQRSRQWPDQSFRVA